MGFKLPLHRPVLHVSSQSQVCEISQHIGCDSSLYHTCLDGSSEDMGFSHSYIHRTVWIDEKINLFVGRSRSGRP